ncbi:YggS family pyridoxal phosphate-dependent enzyme [Candidatus Peregrinibacteria bacterium]|jgi:PLP dependent protein|nr:YggS family pyridoxal phosphate-dependent enzyme [Candidatus Peregrinibacteria bacterium]
MNLPFYQQLKKQLGSTEQKAKLVAVTKYSEVDEINKAISAGINIIGENRLQDAEKKFPYLLPVEKHFIGTIQSKKLRKIFNLFDVIESLGSYEHLEKLNNIAEEEGKIAKIFLQVNVSSESQKSGFLPLELKEITGKTKNMNNICIQGIMGMAEKTDNEMDIRMQFRLAKNIFLELQKDIPTIKELSLGMSSDYEIALEEGATLVRVGKALFL